jgi:hypothetical protein
MQLDDDVIRSLVLGRDERDVVVPGPWNPAILRVPEQQVLRGLSLC